MLTKRTDGYGRERIGPWALVAFALFHYVSRSLTSFFEHLSLSKNRFITLRHLWLVKKSKGDPPGG